MQSLPDSGRLPILQSDSLHQPALIAQLIAEARQDGGLQGVCGKTPAPFIAPASLHQPVRDVVAIAFIVLYGMGGRQTVPGLVVDETCEKVLPAGPHAAFGRSLPRQGLLNRIPRLPIDNRLMLTRPDLTSMTDISHIDRI